MVHLRRAVAEPLPSAIGLPAETAVPPAKPARRRRVSSAVAVPDEAGASPTSIRKGVATVGKHDPTRDGDVHPDTAKRLDPKDFEKSGQPPTDDDDDDDSEDDDD
jgi:hypothetical protein